MNNIFEDESKYMFRKKFSYGKFKTAEYLYRLLESKNAIYNNRFFDDVLDELLGDLRPLLREIIETVKSAPKSSVRTNALKFLKGTRDWDKRDVEGRFDDILEELPKITGIFRTCLMRRLSDMMNEQPYDLQTFVRARRHMKKLFLLSDTMLNVFECLYFLENSAIGRYLSDEIEIWTKQNRYIAAKILDIKTSELEEAISSLLSYGLIETYRDDNYQIDDNVLPIWETPEVYDMSKFFCSPLKGKTLPLEMFRIPENDLNYVMKLLTSKTKAPINIMLYGPPGTGKTTFVRSLAKALRMKAWSVNATDNGNRRAALVACLNIARKHKNSFVLVDEAENMLDIGFRPEGKSWLNTFLEKSDNKIIWVTNNVHEINAAVKRRFSFSIFFDNLGKRERNFLFRDVIHEHKAERYFDDAQIMNLAKNYEVSAGVIDSAVRQAKSLRYGKRDFVRAVESSLNAYSRFMHNGYESVRRNIEVPEGFVTEGITLEGSLDALMARCRKADSAMRNESFNMTGGCATMLFYGPPGTGKTALARYIAHELDRECFIVRASDLLNCYVGMTEKSIAEAFRHAEMEGSVLVIDEADTFLYSRDNAVRSWEISEVNEFLTNLEECRCFCICTTNRFNELDSAAMRRFSCKVSFTWAKPSQILALYKSHLSPLCDSEIDAETERELMSLRRLTPGDFHAVRVQFNSFFEDKKVTHEELLRALKREETLKARYINRDIGF